jgi:hypothetical protein
MGNCPIHQVPFVHKTGVSKTSGRAYDFWGCPERNEDGSYCQEKPTQKAAPNQQSKGGQVTAQGQYTRDPYRIERQHSQDMALREFQAKGIKEFTNDDLKQRINWYMQDLDKTTKEDDFIDF